MNKTTPLSPIRSPAAVLAVAVALVAGISPVAAATLWDESLSGDLSDTKTTPTALVLAQGTQSIVGTLDGSGDSQDWISLVVPAGQALSSIKLISYVSTDGQGFTGVQAGSSFVGSEFSASSYAGYALFGTAATNGGVVGADLLAIMANPALATGATGLAVPIGAGTWTFLIQQLGAATAYQFDYEVVPIPEPTTSLLTTAGLGFLAWRRRTTTAWPTR